MYNPTNVVFFFLVSFTILFRELRIRKIFILFTYIVEVTYIYTKPMYIYSSSVLFFYFVSLTFINASLCVTHEKKHKINSQIFRTFLTQISQFYFYFRCFFAFYCFLFARFNRKIQLGWSELTMDLETRVSI